MAEHTLNYTASQLDALLAKADNAPAWISGREVTNFAALPEAASNSGKYAMVLNGQGTWLINRKSSGVYRSDGSDWDYIGPLPSDDVPTDLSQLEEDENHRTVTDTEIEAWNTAAQDAASAVQPEELSDVATSGDYNDLSGTPTIPTSLADLGEDVKALVVCDQATYDGLTPDPDTVYFIIE